MVLPLIFRGRGRSIANTVSGFTIKRELRQLANHRLAQIQNRRFALHRRGCARLR
jgi:hypothetical protein